MSENERKKMYYGHLFEDLFKNCQIFDYDLIRMSLDEILNSKNKDEELASIENFAQNLSLVVFQIKKERDKASKEAKPIVVNGNVLERDYYSVRTDAPRILGVSAPTLYSRIEEGVIQCLPGFETKMVSAEEIQRYWSKYLAC